MIQSSTEPTQLILPHQRCAFERLLQVGRVCLKADRTRFPVALRTNCLIIGPSGSGKTFLAKAVAKELGLPYFYISAAEWILLCTKDRGSEVTWIALARFLYEHRESVGAMIFIDELHHINGDCPWERFLRVEVFSLLDQRIPQSMNVEVTDADGDDRLLSNREIEELGIMLKTKVFIIGGGAFQEMWEKGASIGFNECETETPLPTLRELSRMLCTEFLNRFRSEIQILKPLSHRDYESMLNQVAEKVPESMRKRFLNRGMERLPEVLRLRQGTRFLEELMTDVILEEEKSRPPLPVITSPENPWGMG